MSPEVKRILTGCSLVWVLASAARADAMDALAAKLFGSPYVTPPTLTPAAPMVASVRKPPAPAKKGKSAAKTKFVLQPIATSASTVQPSVPAWTRRHRTMKTSTWYVATDKKAKVAYYWAPIPDGTIIDEQEGHKVSRSYGGGVVIPYDPSWKSHVITIDAAGKVKKQKLKALASSLKHFAQLNLVRKATAADPVDLVFLPSGFADTELDRFRSAVECVTSGLLGDSAFTAASGAFNVWRMDLSSSVNSHDILKPPTCIPSVVSTIGAPRQATAPQNLALDSLGETLVWFHDEAKFISVFDDVVSMLGHDPLLTVVLENEEAQQGAGQVGAGVAIASLTGIDDKTTGYRLSSHELGHALGLYDEVGKITNDWLVPYDGGGPNVVSDAEIGANQVPPAWAGHCATTPCTSYVRETDPCHNGTPNSMKDTFGLWHGGDFRCDMYSPTNDCRMSFYAIPEFCGVCKDYISTALSAAAASSGPSIPLPGSSPPPSPPPPPPSTGGSNDTIAQLRFREFTAEIVVRCMEVTLTKAGRDNGTHIVTLLPTDPPVRCGLGVPSMRLDDFQVRLGELGVKAVVNRVADNIKNKVWTNVEAVYLHKGGMQ